MQSDRARTQARRPERYAAAGGRGGRAGRPVLAGPGPARRRRPPPGAPGLPGAERAGRAGPAGVPGPDGCESDIAGRRARWTGPALPADVALPTDPARRAAVAFALAQVGRPYVFGAKGPRAFDCSGLTQAAWAAAGVGISAGTLTQIHDGAPVASLADLAPGDLLFSPGSLGTPSRPRHVGLYAGDGLVVEAHSRHDRGDRVTAGRRGRTKTVAIRRIAAARAAAGAAGAAAPAPTPRGAPTGRRAGRAAGAGPADDRRRSRRVVSPAADRDLLAVAGLAAFLAAIGGDQRRAGGRRRDRRGAARRAAAADPRRRAGCATAVRILADADDPGRRLAAPWTRRSPGTRCVYWAVAAVLLAADRGRGRRRRRAGCGGGGGPPRPGTPPARRSAGRCRVHGGAAHRGGGPAPGMSARDRARAPLEEVGAPLHRGPIGRDVLAVHQPHRHPRPDPDAASPAPTWCTRSWPRPAALLCSTTKPDLLEFAALARTRRRQAGPVLVFDATGSVAWPAQVRWSPISGCRRLPHRLPAGAHPGRGRRGPPHRPDLGQRPGVPGARARWCSPPTCWPRRCTGRGVGVLVRWAIGKPPDTEPADLLEPFYPELAAQPARRDRAGRPDLRRGVAVGAPGDRAAARPRAAGAVHARARRRVRRPRATSARAARLFLVAGEHQAAHATPILTALAEHWLTTAQQMALQYPTRRLDPPATAILDELPNATPIPQLPDIISDSAGRGVLIHWAAQSAAQLEDTFTPARARQLLDNSTTMTFWGGIKDARTLEWISTLAGHHEAVRWQHHTDGLLTPGRSSLGTETVPTYRPGDVRTLEQGRVLVVHANLRPIHARAVDVSARPDWPQLRADVDAVRRGDVDVDTAGFAIPAHRAGFQPPPILHT